MKETHSDKLTKAIKDVLQEMNEMSQDEFREAIEHEMINNPDKVDAIHRLICANNYIKK